jgi:hypothetical protein
MPFGSFGPLRSDRSSGRPKEPSSTQRGSGCWSRSRDRQRLIQARSASVDLGRGDFYRGHSSAPIHDDREVDEVELVYPLAEQNEPVAVVVRVKPGVGIEAAHLSDALADAKSDAVAPARAPEAHAVPGGVEQLAC